MFLDAIDPEDINNFHKQKYQSFPDFSYTYPTLNLASNSVLLGDAIHTVKPYFGLGLNTAFEDIKILYEELTRVMMQKSLLLPSLLVLTVKASLPSLQSVIYIKLCINSPKLNKSCPEYTIS